jgi:hypothetical protein
MARLKGLGSFLVIAAALVIGLRALHVGVPLIFPDTRPGPFALSSLDDARRLTGFAPLVPGYHPVSLGTRAASLTVTRSPYPTLVAVWRGERRLSITEQLGGPMPDHPPAAQPLADVADSLRWSDGTGHRLLLRRGELWVTVETDLPSRDLKRLADTLRPY